MGILFTTVYYFLYLMDKNNTIKDYSFIMWGKKISVIFLIIFTGIIYIQVGLYGMNFPSMEKEFKISNLQYSFLVAALKIGDIVFAPLFAHYSTMYPPTKILTVSTILAMVADVAFIFTRSYYFMFLGIIFIVPMWSSDNLLSVLVDHYAPNKSRALYTGSLFGSQLLGVLIGLVIGAKLNFRWNYAFTASFTCPLAFILFLIDGPKALPRKNISSKLKGNFWKSIFKTLTIPQVWGVTILNTSLNAVVKVQLDLLVKYTDKEFGWTKLRAAILLGCGFFLFGAIAIILGAYKLDFYKNKKCLNGNDVDKQQLFKVGIQTGVFPLLVAASTQLGFIKFGETAFIICCIVMGVSTNFYQHKTVQIWSVNSDLVPYCLSIRGWASAIQQGIFVLLAGWMLDHGFSYPSTFIYIGQWMWISVFFVFLLSFTNLLPGNYRILLNKG